MDIAVLIQKLCHVEIRRLLLIMGMVVAAVVVFQFFALPFGTILSLQPASKGSMFMKAGDVTLSSKSKSIISFIVPVAANSTNYSDLEEEASYDSASNDDINLDYSFEIHEEDRNSHNEFTFEKGVTYDKSLTMEHGRSKDNSSDKSLKIKNIRSKDNSSTQEKAREFKQGSLNQVENSNTNSKLRNDLKADTKLKLEEVHNQAGFASLPLVSTGANKSLMSNVKKATDTQSKAKNTELWQTVSVTLNKNSTMTSNHIMGRRVMRPTSISQMNSLLVQSFVSSSSTRPRWSSARDRELLSAKLQIEKAPILRNTPGLYASLFRNVSMFKRSYDLMERMLKIYIYREGEKPIFHQPRLNGIYASEGWFMKLIEGNKQFVVRDPRKAHLFYLPFSLKKLRIALDEQNSHSWRDLLKYLNNYVDMIAEKHWFWNRTGGADHFLVACHDWALQVTSERMQNCIRVLCNANVAKGFKIGKDATLPVTYVRKVEDPLRDLGGKPTSERPILAFFAGSMHGYLRSILLQYWENKEDDMKIFGPMPRDTQGKKNYREQMKSSKYCICVRGYEVHTPRVVESIFYECVPVIISDNYVPPFFEVLEWEAFAVFVREKDIPNLRNILLSIPEEKYLAMQLRVKMVQRHFLWHKKTKKYDLFHMILHSVWYKRVFQIKAR